MSLLLKNIQAEMKSKVFIYLFLAIYKLSALLLCRYDDVILLQTFPRVLISSEFSMTKKYMYIFETGVLKQSNLG